MTYHEKMGYALKSIYLNKIFLAILIMGIIVMFLDTNLETYCTPNPKRILPISNSEIFLIYSGIFLIVNVFLLIRVTAIGHTRKSPNNMIHFIIVCSQLLFFIIFIIIYLQMVTFAIYQNFLILFTVYGTLFFSAGLLLFAAAKFFHWYSIRKNSLVLLYGLVMSSLVINAIVGIFYFEQINLSHGDTIKRTSCRAIFGSLYNVNPDLIYELKKFYDITSISSFVLAWIATVVTLKPYHGLIKNLRFLVMVSVPLFFFLTRYEAALYYLLRYQATDILSTIKLSSDIYGSEWIDGLLNSNLQLGGIFFALAFLIVGMKILKNHQLKRAMMISGIGMLFLFGSKDLSPLYYASYPPVGIVAVAFMTMGSYLVITGIINSAALVARDKELRSEFYKSAANRIDLLRTIGVTEMEKEIIRKYKSIEKLTRPGEMRDRLFERENLKGLSPDEINDLDKEDVREILRDVLSELYSKSKHKSVS